MGGGRSVPVAVRRERVDVKAAQLVQLGAAELNRHAQPAELTA
ncbi:hypothetical protein [Catellatospora tritici]|nr:hypothetical protein [Catellatospora tritici]